MTPKWFHRDLFEGDAGSDVSVVALKVGSGGHTYDYTVVALVRGFQRVQGLPITGVVDAVTASRLGESSTYGLVPIWYQPPFDEVGLRSALHADQFTRTEDAVRRYQSATGRVPTGQVDEALAIEIGE